VEEIFFSFRDRARKPSAVRGKSEQHRARCEAALAGPTCHCFKGGRTMKKDNHAHQLPVQLTWISFNIKGSFVRTWGESHHGVSLVSRC
jgi:hypothetical protein